MKKKVNMKRFVALFLLICTMATLFAIPAQAAPASGHESWPKSIMIEVPSGYTTIIVTNLKKETTFCLYSEGGNWNNGSKYSSEKVIKKDKKGTWSGVKSKTKFRVCVKGGGDYKVSFGK